MVAISTLAPRSSVPCDFWFIAAIEVANPGVQNRNLYFSNNATFRFDGAAVDVLYCLKKRHLGERVLQSVRKIRRKDKPE